VGIAGLYAQSVDVARMLDAYDQQDAAVGKRCEHIRVAMRVDEDDFDPEGGTWLRGQNSLLLTLSHMRRGHD